MQMTLVVAMLLQAAAPAAAQTPIQVAQAQPAKQKANDPNQVICKRKLRAGSLAAFEKRCHTRAEWQRLSDEERENWGELQGSKGSSHGG
ncbi:MAG TPA: hypothetical protein VE567_09620 [Sphingomonas sp.]|nr:hypothetical protein [Sphingomonas sp.]